MGNARRLGRGTKPNINDQALPNLLRTELFVRTLSLMKLRMRYHLAGTVTRLNVEHRTPNIERWIVMTLRFVDLMTSESKNPPSAEKAYSAFLDWPFDPVRLSTGRIRYSTLDVQCSMLDVHFLVDPIYEFLLRSDWTLAASGCAHIQKPRFTML
jgi:hypothetical protein